MLKYISEFGWSASLGPAGQRAAVQAALDSGAPIGLTDEVITTDDTLNITNPNARIITLGPASFTCMNPASDVIAVQASYVELDAPRINGVTNCTGAAIRVGPKTDGDYAIYVTIRNPRMNGNHAKGVHARKFGGLIIEGGMVNAKNAALYWENMYVDSGDSRIIGVDINADNAAGYGLHWKSGGGLYITQCKFSEGFGHVRLEMLAGNTGSLLMHGNSLEGNTPISIDLMGNTWFNRCQIVDNSIGVLGCAIAVRNFNPAGGQPVAWLGQFLVEGNVIEAGYNGSPVIDLGCAWNPLIGANSIYGRGPASCGIIVRPQCQGGKIDQAGSVIVGCNTPISNSGTGTVIV